MPFVVPVRADGRSAVAVAAPDRLAPDVLAPVVLVLALAVLPPDVLLVLAPDVVPEVLPLELLPLEAPAAEVLVRSDVFVGAVLSLVARPASAIPPIPPLTCPNTLSG